MAVVEGERPAWRPSAGFEDKGRAAGRESLNLDSWAMPPDMLLALADRNAANADLGLAEALMGAVGRVVRLEDEAQMDAVTAVSGSGPAYVFHLIEAMAAAGVAQGLPADLSLELARMTVAGAGALAVDADQDPAVLRENVTSPGGTTAAGLKVLMDPETGLPPLMARTVAAATERGRELGAAK